MINPSSRERVATLARRGSWLAFSALVVLSPLRARIQLDVRRTGNLYGDYTDFLLFVSDIALLATLAFWGIELVVARRRLRPGPWFIVIPTAVLVTTAWVGVPASVDAALTVATALRLMALAALALYVVDELGSLARIVPPVAGMIVVQAVVGIGQVVGQRSLGWRRLGELTLSPRLGVSVVTASDGTRYLRAYGLADHPNVLGGVIAFGSLLLVAAAPTGRRGVAHAAMGLGAVTLFLTFSRGAWIAFVIGFVVLLGGTLARGDRTFARRLAVTGAAAMLVVVPFVAPFRAVLAARTGSSSTATERRSVSEREALTDATTKLVSKHALLGVGAGAVAVALARLEPDFAYSYQPAPVVVLDVTAELGVVGGGAFVALVVSPWLALLVRRRRATPELVVASALVAAVTIVGLFDYYPWSYSSGRIWLWLSFGVWAWAYQDARAKGGPIGGP